MTEITLSPKGKARMLRLIKETLGPEKTLQEQMGPFMAGKMKTRVSYTKVYWTVVGSDAVNGKARIGQPYLTNSWVAGHEGNGYMHYGRADAKFFEVHHSTGGMVYMKGDTMILDTYPDIGKTFSNGVDVVRLDKVELDEDNIHIIIGPAIW